MTLKRGRGRALVPLHELLAREDIELAENTQASPDRIYEPRWALALLEQVLFRLANEYRAAGRAELFTQLKATLEGEPDRGTQAEVATKLGMSENAVKQAFYRLRGRYRQLVRQEIMNTVAAAEDVDDELRHFITILQT